MHQWPADGVCALFLPAVSKPMAEKPSAGSLPADDLLCVFLLVHGSAADGVTKKERVRKEFVLSKPECPEVGNIDKADDTSAPVAAYKSRDGVGNHFQIAVGNIAARKRILSKDQRRGDMIDRKSTRLNSSHVAISYAV